MVYDLMLGMDDVSWTVVNTFHDEHNAKMAANVLTAVTSPKWQVMVLDRDVDDRLKCESEGERDV